MKDRRSEIRYENGREMVRACVTAATVGSESVQDARTRAKESLAAFREQKDLELQQASKRFALLQRIEFVIGALVLIQIAVFMLKGEPYIVALVYSTTASILIYIIVAFNDSRAKSRKLDVENQLLAAKKVKLKNGKDSVIVEFE